MSETPHDVIITLSVLEEPRYFDIRATSALPAAATVPCRRYPVRWRCCCYNNTSSVPPQQHTSRHSRAGQQHLCHGRVFSTHGPCRDHHSCHLYSSVAAAVEHSQIISDSLLYFQNNLNYFKLMLTSPNLSILLTPIFSQYSS